MPQRGPLNVLALRSQYGPPEGCEDADGNDPGDF
jgi:hypothetical protein